MSLSRFSGVKLKEKSMFFVSPLNMGFKSSKFLFSFDIRRPFQQFASKHVYYIETKRFCQAAKGCLTSFFTAKLANSRKDSKQYGIYHHNACAGGHFGIIRKGKTENKAQGRHRNRAKDNSAKAFENTHRGEGGKNDKARYQKRTHYTHSDNHNKCREKGDDGFVKADFCSRSFCKILVIGYKKNIVIAKNENGNDNNGKGDAIKKLFPADKPDAAEHITVYVDADIADACGANAHGKGSAGDERNGRITFDTAVFRKTQKNKRSEHDDGYRYNKGGGVKGKSDA
jgi:hypothetical protein